MTVYDEQHEISFFLADWSMRGSELSALVAEPKLEDFLGGISFSEQQNHKGSCNMISSSSSTCYPSSGVSTGYHQLYHQPSSALQFADSIMVASSAAGVHDGSAMLSAATANGGAAAASSNGGSFGLSMIKNWLRSQPAPPQPTRVDAAADGAQAAQGLSLSMNMAGAQGGSMPLAGGDKRGRAGTESVSTSVQQAGSMAGRKEDSSGGSGGALVAVSTPDTGGSGEAVPRKTVDTFGQRTSIYRGVTR